MKKSLITIILCTVAMGVGYAQFTDGLVLQPTSVVAKRFDASGQLIKEMTSTYSYDESGKLTGYDVPDHNLWSTYSYNDNLLMREYIQHEDLTSFDYKVNKSIAITSTNGDVSVGSSNKVTFRTSGFFEITGPFQVDSGGELTVIMQSCPE